jgi:anaerobic nitric oxide reductase transcription regulator
VIFMDEVGDLHQAAQAMLLRALATGEFRPLGASRPRSADVRVISATNRPLNQLMMTEEFRYDLFFRLRHFQLAVPPLRERGDDWQLIAGRCLDRLAAKYGVAKRLSPRAAARLGAYDWPGNVRQLISVISTGYALADEDQIEPDDFENLIDGHSEPRAAMAGPDLLDALKSGQQTFWDAVHAPFLNRDLNREQVRAVIRDGLAEAGGSYRRLLDLFRMAAADYQKLMDFLRHHNLKPQEPSRGHRSHPA